LCWLLDEPRSDEVRAALAGAELVLSSSLTLVECDRVLIRAVTSGSLAKERAAERRTLLAESTDHWIVFAIDAEIVERARQPFPAEPVRTLDALHLATLFSMKPLVPDLALLSLDERVRRSARLLGVALVPAEGPKPV
jgi:predicted nucleic acid-binding protein